MSLADILGELQGRQARLTVLNRTDPEPVQRMLENLFEGTGVAVSEAESGTGTASNLVILESADGLAVSTLDAVRDNILLVNSDLYITGARSLEEIETPDVIAELSDLPFRVRGYPDTSKGKLMLIEISRFIEARAHEAGVGTVRSGFQRLSRIDDERGTAAVYDRLAASDLDVHVYGAPDTKIGSPLNVHGAEDAELLESWFVVYTHPKDPGRSAALLAILDQDCAVNEWDGFWTYDPDRVGAIDTYLAEAY